MKEERGKREGRQVELQGRLERKIQTEKLLISVIEGKLKKKEIEGEKKLERERMIAEKVIEIAKLDNRVKYELPLDPSLPSFLNPFSVSFTMSHHSAAFLPPYKTEELFTLPLEHLKNYKKYITFQKNENKRVIGTIRPTPFAKGGFRYAYFAMISEGITLGGPRERGREQVVLKHIMDVYEKYEEGEGRGELGELRECVVGHLLGRRVVEEFRKRRVKGCGEVVMVGCDVLEWGNPTLVFFFFFFFFFFVFVFCFLFLFFVFCFLFLFFVFCFLFLFFVFVFFFGCFVYFVF